MNAFELNMPAKAHTTALYGRTPSDECSMALSGCYR